MRVSENFEKIKSKTHENFFGPGDKFLKFHVLFFNRTCPELIKVRRGCGMFENSIFSLIRFL